MPDLPRHTVKQPTSATLGTAGARGDLPRDVEVDEFATLPRAAAMGTLVGWAATRQSREEVCSRLCRRADIILCGAAFSYRR